MLVHKKNLHISAVTELFGSYDVEHYQSDETPVCNKISLITGFQYPILGECSSGEKVIPSPNIKLQLTSTGGNP